jgi:VanZ family protein
MSRLFTALKPYSKYFLIVWIILILVVSSIPSLPTLKIQTHKSVIRLDYLIHFCEYGLLAFLAYLTNADSYFKINLKKYLIITSGLILFAVLDELHQELIPGRTFNVKDILSNISGISAALVFCTVVFKRIGNSLMVNP